MDQAEITEFSELLTHLDGLVEAAWNAEVDPRLTRQLAAIRQRLVRLQGHLTGQSNPGHTATSPRPQAVESQEDLLRQFGELVGAARASRAFPLALTHYLHNAHQRLNYFLHNQEKRLASRASAEEGRTATLAWAGETAQVRVVDSSPFGVGILADRALEPDQVVTFQTTDRSGRERTYECLTIHCRPHGDHYYIGLEIFTSRL